MGLLDFCSACRTHITYLLSQKRSYKMDRNKNQNNSSNMSGRHNINSGNQFNINSSGDNSPITIELHNNPRTPPLPRFEATPIELKTLKTEKLYELILPGILTLAEIVLFLVDKFFIDTAPWSIIIPFSMLLLLIIIAGLVGCVIHDFFKIHKLKNVGQTGYYAPKWQTVLQLLVVLFEIVLHNNAVSVATRIHRVFKNEEDNIFEIKRCPCPYCKSKPIGYMYPKKLASNSIVFVCDQNTDHTLKLDCKQLVLE